MDYMYPLDKTWVEWPFYVVRIVLLISSLLAFTYCRTQILYNLKTGAPQPRSIPPIVPYAVPFLGSALEFAFNGKKFIDASAWRSGKQIPFAMHILNCKMFVVAGADNIHALWKMSGEVAGSSIQIFFLRYLFAMPDKALQMYIEDKSGIGVEPAPGSDVKPHNRLDYLTHISMLKFLNGQGLSGYFARWQAQFECNLSRMNLRSEWSEFADFQSFWDDTFALAVIEAFTGPLLRKIDPDLISDLRQYDHYVPKLSRGLPRWMNRKAYATRDKLIAAIVEWHSTARARRTVDSIDTDQDADPFWGSEFIRERQQIFSDAENFGYAAFASSDLGFIWASITNLAPSSMWEVFETFSDPSLLSRVRAELASVLGADLLAQSTYDHDKVPHLHTMQAIYAEVLRQRVYAFAARYTEKEELLVNNWLFPKDSAMLISTAPAHMDATVWNTGSGSAKHPVEEFWADRFLADPKDRDSGPCKKGAKGSSAPVFSTAGTNGSWIPYGGGPRACPGKSFAKRAMMTALAVMASRYDIEFLLSHDSPALRLDPENYGWGGQRPVGLMPFRIRLRQDR